MMSYGAWRTGSLAERTLWERGRLTHLLTHPFFQPAFAEHLLWTGSMPGVRQTVANETAQILLPCACILETYGDGSETRKETP